MRRNKKNEKGITEFLAIKDEPKPYFKIEIPVSSEAIDRYFDRIEKRGRNGLYNG